ncbi:Uma2 family endonuclease [Aphanothece sacrum]|uniref:Putative restriction endonuclease domain-containing protein n=1 Tax=Aphanothece sacrum FPU1 TaxID=1920663 RepID=A0A401IHK1_APHSA|nr:Uma2 family endonuclease [Aphanothece sacrum]GBF80680.1 hypothetical protein AsFPU1_2084 [Aphanothece sacrum FPU1]GBF83174.1 hypothetical protein AsFPU3_0213 [Aphanothece sacrum FPU3]
MLKTQESLYTFEEYCNYNDDPDNRYELVNGKLEIMNPPTFRHLLIAKFLEQEFDKQIKQLNLPWVCLKDAGIRTGWRKSRLPDLYIIPLEEIREYLDKSAISETPPLLVVEVISPDSIKRDYRYKRSEYAALGIPEYWIIDPLENTISILQLEDGFYEEKKFTNQDTIISLTFPELSLTVTKVLESEKND